MKIFFKNVEKSDLGCKIKVFDKNILAKQMACNIDSTKTVHPHQSIYFTHFAGQKCIYE